MKQGVEGQPKGVIKHVEHELRCLLPQDWAHEGACVHLNEPNSKIFIKQEIESNDLEFIARAPAWIEAIHCSYMTVNHNVSHSLHDLVRIQVRQLLTILCL